MANLPSAKVSLDETSGAFASGTGYLVVLSPVATSADLTPRIFSSLNPLLSQYGYAQGVDYCASHFDETGSPVIFVGMPIDVEGAVGSFSNAGMTGTSLITVTTGASGSMDECQGILSVVRGGTVGTDQIVLSLSLDNGETSVTVRLGTGNSYTIPYVGLVLNFGAGTLEQGDVYKFNSTAPMWNDSSITSARTALAAQQALSRSWLVVGEVATAAEANAVLTEASNYETEDQRFVYARVNVKDGFPGAQSSQIQKTAQIAAAQTITFAASGHTITRSAGSFVTDGFAIGDLVTVAGTTSNNGLIGVLTGVSATILTFGSGVVNEGPLTGGVTITGAEEFVFAATGHTVTRGGYGSFVADGFVVGQTVVAAGTVDNNGTLGVLTAVSATVLTFAAGLSNETVSSFAASLTSSLTQANFVTAAASTFSSINGESAKRLDIAIGRGRKASAITGWNLRRPCSWAASLREYQHDLEIPCWRKSDGALLGWSITDDNGNTSEYDERVYGEALSALFTCMRSWANGPGGAYIALSLTRDTDGAFLSRTQNLAVADFAEQIIQTTTENAIGTVLELNVDGTVTEDSAQIIEEMVNTALQINLLQNFAEGPRASLATWSASRTDDLAPPGATWNGSLDLELNGTLEQIDTVVRVS